MPDIEFHRRSLATVYAVLSICFVILGALFVIAAIGQAVGKEPWSEKGVAVGQWTFGGLLWLLSAPKMWTMGTAYRKSLVRFTATQVTFVSASGNRYDIPYVSIKSLDWDSSVRKRILTIDTAETKYTFDQKSSPSIGKVAELLQQRTGITA